MSRNTSERGDRRGASVGFLAFCAAIVAGSALVAAGDEPAARLARVDDFAPANEFVETGGFRTHYVVKGESGGRPIVFLHGFGSCTYTWRLNLPALAAKGFRVYAIDIKGFGLTEKPRDGAYHLAAFTRQLLHFLDAMKLDRPILVGNSMGGAIITRLALRYPERVGGIVLVDSARPSFDLRDAPGRLLRDRAARPAPISPISQRLGIALARTLVTKKTIEMGLRGAYHDPKFVTNEAVEIYYRPFTIDGAAEALVAMTTSSHVDLKDDIPRPIRTLKVPALIVWGRFDPVIPVAMADWFSRELPRAKTIILEKSGHMPHEEEADAFNALLVEFAASFPRHPS
jgi:pimeloyl-ACP methyl ester carboxylesterase